MEKACYINNIFINAINNNVVMFIKREFAVSFCTKVTILTKSEAGSILFQGIVDVENIVQNISSGFRIFSTSVTYARAFSICFSACSAIRSL